jgi:moderate conductance mechanosensitive channel
MASAPSVPPTTSAPILSDPTPLSSDGYLYRLFRELGMSRRGALTSEFLIIGPLRVFGIAIAAFVIARFGRRLIRRGVTAARLRAPLRIRSNRAEQRSRTVGEAIGSLWVVIVSVLATLMVLQQVGVNLGPLVAGAGIVGVAVAFGAQSLIKDYLSGLFILLEDQYSVGDVITLGTATGTVEDVNLRVTRLRAADGTVWFVPNGEVRSVGNLSMEWSRAIVDVTLAYDNDIPGVLELLATEVNAFAAEPRWATVILEPPEVQGVQSMGTDGVTIRIVAKTAPRRQWEVARELRARVTNLMRRDGMRGPGRTVMVSSGTLEGGVPVPAPPEVLDDRTDRTDRTEPRL